MTKLYVGPGDGYMYTNAGSAISAGDIVLVEGLIGVASVDIANGASGWVHTEGVFTCAKVSTAVIAAGEAVILDVSQSPDAFEDSAATPGTGDITGAAWAHKAAGNGATTVDVVLKSIQGTVN